MVFLEQRIRMERKNHAFCGQFLVVSPVSNHPSEHKLSLQKG